MYSERSFILHCIQLQETKTPCVSYKKRFGDEDLLNREYTVDREYNYHSEYISISEEIEFIWELQ